MGIFSSKNKFPVDGRTILITGGSQGMGRSVARLLASKGANVLVVARGVEKLKETVEYISAAATRPSQRFSYISADLTSPSESERILSETTAWNDGQPPNVVWNCAGSSRPGLFIETPVESFRDQMDANYMSSVYIAHAALSRWLSGPPTTPKSPEPRHIIFTSSVLAFYPLVGYSPYTSSKSALRTLSDALSQELLLYSHLTPVKTHTIFPATIFTASYEEENKTKPAVTKKLEESDGGQTPDEVAIASVKGLERGEELVTTSGVLGYAMKVGMLGSSVRNGWAAVDTIASWAANVVFVFVRWDMDRTVKKWGKTNPPSTKIKG